MSLGKGSCVPLNTKQSCFLFVWFFKLPSQTWFYILQFYFDTWGKRQMSRKSLKMPDALSELPHSIKNYFGTWLICQFLLISWLVNGYLNLTSPVLFYLPSVNITLLTLLTSKIMTHKNMSEELIQCIFNINVTITINIQ